MRVLASRNEQLHTTTILVHNMLPAEIFRIQEAMSSTFFRRLSLHPVFIFAVIIELICISLQFVASDTANAAVKPTNQASPHLREDEKMEAENIDIETEAAKALGRHHDTVQLLADLQLTMSVLNWAKSCCSDFDESGSSPEQREFFKTAGIIIRDQLGTIGDRLKIAEVQARSAQSFTQAYKQSVNPLHRRPHIQNLLLKFITVGNSKRDDQ
jgi:hypothetical protein